MAELVDALVSGTSIERCGGSSPLLGTMDYLTRRTVTEFRRCVFVCPNKNYNNPTRFAKYDYHYGKFGPNLSHFS
jgi:hypothetical protein